MKKGIASQVFIYIFMAIVIALILFFGFKQIVGLQDLTQKTYYVAFKEDLNSAVSDIYYKNAGSVLVFSTSSRNKPLILPKDIKEVCFGGNEIIFDNLKYDKFEIENLKGDICIRTVQSSLSFKLENVVVGEDVKVKISGVGT